MSDNTYPQTWYVYVYIDDEAVPFYVGKGTRGRMFAHEEEARTECDCQKCQKIRDLWSRGKTIIKHIVFETFNEGEAYQYEHKLISEYVDTLLNLAHTPRRKKKYGGRGSGYAQQVPVLTGVEILPTVFNGVDIGRTPIMVKQFDDNGNLLMEYPLNALFDAWGPVA